MFNPARMIFLSSDRLSPKISSLQHRANDIIATFAIYARIVYMEADCMLSSKMDEQARMKSKLENLSKQIQNLVKREEDTEQERKTKLKLIESLRNFFESTFNYKIYVIGSNYGEGAGRFSVKRDRLEVVYTKPTTDSGEISTPDRIFNKMFERSLDFENLKMKSYGEIKDEKGISDPPYIHFTSPNFLISGALSLNDDGSKIRNSHLVECYLKMDDRVRPLLMVVEVWWFSNKTRSKKFGLTSFDLTLMVIHYLQFGCEPPVLPCLSEMLPDVFKYDSDFDQLDPEIELPEFKSSNNQQVGELLIGFLDYFANKFKFNKKAISVRVGRAIKRKQSRHFGEHDYICIEDPFTRKCTVAQSVERKRPLRIRDTRKPVKQAFKKALADLNRNHDLQVLIESHKRIRIGKMLHLKELTDFRKKLFQVARVANQPKLKQ